MHLVQSASTLLRVCSTSHNSASASRPTPTPTLISVSILNLYLNLILKLKLLLPQLSLASLGALQRNVSLAALAHLVLFDKKFFARASSLLPLYFGVRVGNVAPRPVSIVFF